MEVSIMKTISIDSFKKLVTADIDKRSAKISEKKQKLQHELDSLKDQITEEEKKLAGLADDVQAFKQQFHLVSELKVDQAAIENLLSVCADEQAELKNEAIASWNANYRSCTELITPLVEEYNKKLDALFEDYLQIVKSQAALIKLRDDLNSKYQLSNELTIVSPFNVKGDPNRCFGKHFFEKAGGDPHQLVSLKEYGELRK